MTAPPSAGKPSAKPVAGAAHLPALTAKQVGRWLAIATGGEQQLRDALLLMASRHGSEPQIRDTARVLAGWCVSHLGLLEPLRSRFGAMPSEHPERLRSALFYGTRVGGMGLLQDLQDLLLLAHQVRSSWTVLMQVADELHDAELATVADEVGRETDRQLAWIESQLKEAAPQTLAVPADPAPELAASLPRTPRIASIPDPLWAPAVGSGLILLAGIVGLAIGQPILVASLGPTAYLQADSPALPASRLWNVLLGHLSGVIAALLGLAVFNAWTAPTPLIDHVLVPERVGASAVAIVATILIAAFLRASHPPAAATALLLSLGALRTQQDLINLALGVLIVGSVGELVRRARLTGVIGERPREGLSSTASLAQAEQSSARAT
jgi:hypothetical protein